MSNYRDHKRALRTMKDGNLVLDTMTGLELLRASELAIQSNLGDSRYLDVAKRIVKDYNKYPRNFYVTLPMRRSLMGYVRPIFVEEWERRNTTKKINQKG